MNVRHDGEPTQGDLELAYPGSARADQKLKDELVSLQRRLRVTLIGD